MNNTSKQNQSLMILQKMIGYLVCWIAGSDLIDELGVAVSLHGLADAVEVGGDRLVHLGVVEVAVPLPSATCPRKIRF